MGFPKEDYEKAIAELRSTVLDRDAKGRNETNDFYSQFPHGNQDLTFELKRRVERILGAEQIGDLATVYGDTLDLANYAIFSMMMLKREMAKTSSTSSHAPSEVTAVFPALAQEYNRPLGSTAQDRYTWNNTPLPAEYLYQSPPAAARPDTLQPCSPCSE
jgi:hypothetical protein